MARRSVSSGKHGVPIGPPWSRVHRGSRWVTVKASRLGADIAVATEPSTAADHLDMHARACGLTRRESEVSMLPAPIVDGH